MYLIKYSLQKILRVISYSVFFKDNYVVHSCGDFGFSVNGKANYQALKLAFPDKKIVFVSDKKVDFGYWTYSFLGFLYIHFSKNIVTDGGIPFSVNTRKKKVLNTWHGIPIKNIGFDTFLMQSKLHKKIIKEKVSHTGDAFFLGMGNKYNSILTRSLFVKKNKFILSLTPYLSQVYSDFNNVEKKDRIKSILYIPTYRDGLESSWDLLRDPEYSRFLLNSNITVYYKYHPLDRNVRDVNKEFYQVEGDYKEIIKKVDLVITDYSSVIFEAALLNIPLSIYAKDYNEYVEKRGIYDKDIYFSNIVLPVKFDQDTVFSVFKSSIAGEEIKKIKKNYFTKEPVLFDAVIFKNYFSCNDK